jgi:hypothetical protein
MGDAQKTKTEKEAGFSPITHYSLPITGFAARL